MFRWTHKTYRLEILCAAILAFAAGRVPAVHGAEDDVQEVEQVDQLLGRLGLTRLQIAHLEQVVQPETGEPRDSQRGDNIRYARQLADLYAEELMQSAEDAERYDDLMGRVQQLLRNVPAAKTDTLEAMLLQADYGRAEKLAVEWLAHRNRDDVKQQARVLVAKLSERLGAQYQRLNTRMQLLDDSLQKTDDEREAERLEAELTSVGPIAAQTGFFAGWAKYYRGLLDEEKSQLAQARAVFRRLLSLEDETYDEIEASWLALESPWRARAWIGLALTETALGNVDDATLCFDLLKTSAAPASIRDQTDYWRVQSLLNASQWSAAESTGRNLVGLLEGEPSPGKVSLCAALIRGAYCGPGNAVRVEMGEVGMRGLVSLRQWNVLQQIVEEYDIPTDVDRSSFAWDWIRGHRLREEADRTKSSQSYRKARDLFQSALQQEEAKGDLTAASQCRIELAWCQFQLGEYQAAVENYEMASAGLERTVPAAAEQAAWMQFVCLEKLAKSQPSYAEAMRRAAKSLRERFPNSQYADKADYSVRRMSSSRDPAAAIEDLLKVPMSDPDYLPACRDIVQLRYNLWRREPNPDRKRALAQSLRVDWDRYQRVADDESATSRLGVGLWVLEAVVAHRTDPAFAQQLSQELGRVVQQAPTLAANYHYVALSEANARGDSADVDRHMQWLLTNAQGTRFGAAALISAAQRVEAEWKESPDDRGLCQRAYETYENLSKSLGNDVETLRTQANARVALNRQAFFAARLGRNSEAADLMARLLEAKPTSRDILQRACQAHITAKRFDQALPMARTLLRGAKAGSDDWYQAKLDQLICLREVDRDVAKKVWKQLELLDPKLGGRSWRERFEEVGDDL